MATITVQVTAGAQTAGRVRTVANADMADRFLPALRAIFGMPSATDAEVVTEWADRVLRFTLDQIKAHEQDVAARNATVGIGDIPLT